MIGGDNPFSPAISALEVQTVSLDRVETLHLVDN